MKKIKIVPPNDDNGDTIVYILDENNNILCDVQCEWNNLDCAEIISSSICNYLGIECETKDEPI